MMLKQTRKLAALVTGALLLCTCSLWAQKPKSQKELEAIMAVQNATTADERIKAIDNVLTKFADTDYKILLLQMAVQVEDQKGDYAQTLFYAKRLLDADPKNAFAMVMLAAETARRMRENDLDREENTAKVQKWAKDGIEAAKVMPKARADWTDEQLDGARRDLEAQAYEALGMAAAAQKNYAEAISNFKQALATGASPQPATWIRLAQAYIDSGKLAEASDALDKATQTPDVPQQIKNVAETLKQQVAKRKAGSAAPPPENKQP
jgi:tetratricopeptide (TPR) repeat protein